MSDEHVFVVDDEAEICASMRLLFEVAGLKVRTYSSAKQFLSDDWPERGCLVADINMPDMSGLELQEEIVRRHIDVPVIIMTGQAEVPLAVRAMRAGAVDFIEKPFDADHMLASVRRALDLASHAQSGRDEQRNARELLSRLTMRERDVLDKLVRGCSNKVAAHQLSVSPRTIEVHRAHIIGKLGAKNLSDLVRISLIAESGR